MSHFSKVWTAEILPAAQVNQMYRALNGLSIVVDGTDFPQTRAGVQSAINESTAGSVVTIPAGVTITSDGTAIQGKANVTVFAHGATLKLPADASNTTFLTTDWAGGLGTAVALDANASRGNTYLQLVAGGVTSSGLAAGDIFRLWEDTNGDGVYNDSVGAQIFRVRAVNAGTDQVLLTAPVEMSATTANNAKITKITSPTQHFRWIGGTFNANGNSGTTSFGCHYQGGLFCEFRPEAVLNFSVQYGAYANDGYGNVFDIPRVDNSYFAIYRESGGSFRVRSFNSPDMGILSWWSFNNHFDFYSENSTLRGVKVAGSWGNWGNLVGLNPATNYTGVAITNGSSWNDFTVYALGSDTHDLWISGNADLPICNNNTIRGYARLITITAASANNDISEMTYTTLTDGGTNTVYSKVAHNHGSTVQGGRISAAAVRAYKSGATQSITEDAATAVTFDAEDYDTAAMHSTVSNTSRLTAPVAGYYAVSGGVEFENFTAGGATAYIDLYIRANGTTNYGYTRRTNINNGQTYYNLVTVSDIVYLTANQYVEFYVVQHQDTGAAACNVRNTGQTFGSMALVGV